MRILVTGLEGFTGYYLKNELENHAHEVLSFSSDLTDRDAVSAEIKCLQPEAVIHLAAITFVNSKNIQDFYHVNLIGTCNLLAALHECTPNVKSILLASSANVYGNQAEGALSEDMTPNPSNDYAVSKFAMEKMAALWAQRLPLFIVRPFNYTGTRQDDQFLIPKIIQHFQKKMPVIKLGNLEVWREFNDVRMIVDIYRKLIETPPVGKTLNICTGKSYSLSEIIALCEKLTGHAMEVEISPEFVRKNEVKSLMGDNTKLKKLIGEWNEFSLENTLQWMLDSARINHA